MKILVLADVESKYLWDFYEEGRFDGIDLVISCGDLKPHYLSFIATYTKAPVLYVHGNHDECYIDTPPDGCVCIDDIIYEYQGVRILGLGGCMQYNYGSIQYTEKQMSWRITKLLPKLLFHRGFDILVTHAPAYQLNDGEDLPHTGFKAFRKLLDKYRPKYFLHGHMHLNYNHKLPRECKYQEHTTVINGYEKYTFEYDENIEQGGQAPQ